MYCGGGSASLRPYYTVTPLEGIKAQGSDVRYTLGAAGFKRLPLLGSLLKTRDGVTGFTLKFYEDPPSKPKRDIIDQVHLDDSNVYLVDYQNPKMHGDVLYVDLEATLAPEETGEYDFGLTVHGTGKLFIDGNLVIDNETKQTQGDGFIGAGTVEELGSMHMKAGKTYSVLVRYGSAPTSTFKKPGVTSMGHGGFRLGGTRRTNPQSEIEKAVRLAKEVDQVVICAGLSVSQHRPPSSSAYLCLSNHISLRLFFNLSYISPSHS